MRYAPTSTARFQRVHNACPMESEIERLRLDPQLRQKAAEACARHGYELPDVLRHLVLLIAETGTIPFEMPRVTSDAEAAPSLPVDERLWTTMRSQLEAEVAVALLVRFIADCSTALDETADKAQQDPASLARLAEERRLAREVRATLDVTDKTAVEAVLKKYGPLVRRPAS